SSNFSWSPGSVVFRFAMFQSAFVTRSAKASDQIRLFICLAYSQIPVKITKSARIYGKFPKLLSMRRVAIIDMGTNTFHLLVADGRAGNRHDSVYRDHAVVRLGKDGINDGRITESAFSYAVARLGAFRNMTSP